MCMQMCVGTHVPGNARDFQYASSIDDFPENASVYSLQFESNVSVKL